MQRAGILSPLVPESDPACPNVSRTRASATRQRAPSATRSSTSILASSSAFTRTGGASLRCVRASVRANALRLTLGEYGEPYAAPDAEGGPSGQDLPLLTLVLARAEASRLKLRFKN